jgi:restriction system protein
MMVIINPSPPSDWRDLQRQAATILDECGLVACVEKSITTVRGAVSVDVYAEDRLHRPVLSYLCECKHWQSSVPKSIVHAFRTVVTDYGVNCGFVISSAGFQSGAFEAAENTNVRLVTWEEFQGIFVDRWIEKYFRVRLEKEAQPLVDYTEPFNSRIFRKADALTAEAQQEFRELRGKHQALGNLTLRLYLPLMAPALNNRLTVPLKDFFPNSLSLYSHQLSPDVFEAASYRGLLDCLCRHVQNALAEFDGVFGGRA